MSPEDNMLRANVAGAKVPRLGSCQEWNPGPKDYTTPIKTTDRGVMLLIKVLLGDWHIKHLRDAKMLRATCK